MSPLSAKFLALGGALGLCCLVIGILVFIGGGSSDPDQSQMSTAAKESESSAALTPHIPAPDADADESTPDEQGELAAQQMNAEAEAAEAAPVLGEKPDPPAGELDLLDDFEIDEVLADDRVRYIPDSEIDRVDETGRPSAGGEVVWTNIKQFENPADEADYHLTQTTVSRYVSLKGPAIVQADGRIVRHIDVSVFKGGPKSVFVGRFLRREIKTRFSKPEPRHSGLFLDGKKSGKWLLYYEQAGDSDSSPRLRVSGTYNNGKRDGTFECYDRDGVRTWKGTFVDGELFSSMSEPAPALPASMQRITGFINQPGGFVFSPDNRYVAIIGAPTLIAGSRTRANRTGEFEWTDPQTAVIVADTQTGETLFSIPSHSTTKPDVFFSPDNQSLVVTSHLDGAGLWNIEQRKQLLSWIPTKITTADHFSDDGKRFAFSATTVVTEDASRTDEWATYVIEPATATGIQKIDFEKQGSRMYVADLSGDGQNVVLTGKSIFEVFSVNDGKSFGRRGANNPQSIRFVPDTERLRIKYTSRNSAHVYETPFDTNIALRPDFTPAEILRNEHLCVIKDDDIVRMTDAMTGRLLYEVEVPQYDGSFPSQSIWDAPRFWSIVMRVSIR